MGECARCGAAVDELHPVPPAVATRELMDAIGIEEGRSESGVCGECISELMAA